MERGTKHIAIFTILTILAVLSGCSTQNNTAESRWWHAFNARYNTYYNGTLAYIDGSLEKENGNQDNFTEMIPLYTVGNKSSRELGKSNYDRAIEKCEKAIRLHSIKHRPEWNSNRKKTERDKEWLSRREYNPFLWKAWMLMGRSQFNEGKFEDAASTFAYMSRIYNTQPAIYGKARAWLAKCYTEQNLLYDAEDVIKNIERDSIPWQAQKEWDYTYADYYIHNGNYKSAVIYLRKVIRHEMRRKQRAREWFLMGQLQDVLGNKTEAYNAYKRCVRQNPAYHLEFNARIAMTEVMAYGNKRKQMIAKIKRMAANDNNKEYQDQIYYALGNIYLLQGDTLKAINTYERGNKNATRNGIEKGVLLLKLGNLYWDKEKFSDAKRCYDEAIGLLDKERKDYNQMSERSKVLDQLVPYSEAVYLQDSLQTLAQANDKGRNAAIDRVIDALKKKEKEEANTEINMQNGNTVNMINNIQNSSLGTNRKANIWYFYNQTAVNLGKENFQRQWGKRENTDNWQRANRTVVSSVLQQTEQEQDSIENIDTKQDSIKQQEYIAINDPHKREYYMAQIPFTEEKLNESNKILENGLYNCGVIFKDKLNRLDLSERAFRRLTDKHPKYEHMEDVYYHLFLLYSRKKEDAMADKYLGLLKKDYPNSKWTVMLSDPYYKEDVIHGEHLEDSLYTATYNAFKAGVYKEVDNNVHISEKRFPQGANRDKFMFIGALNNLNNGNSKDCIYYMSRLIKEYPESKLSEMAGMIINGVKMGRSLHGGKFDIGDVWSRRNKIISDSDSINTAKFSPERNADFIFLLAYNPDSLNENKLLFELAKYNFTNYLVRKFDIEIEERNGLHQMKVSGFLNYDEARQYARLLYNQQSVMIQAGNSRMIIISKQNLGLLGNQLSYDDYSKFYAKTFSKLRIKTEPLLTEPADIKTSDIREESSAKEEKTSEHKEMPLLPVKQAATTPSQQTKPEPQIKSTNTGIYFDDGFGDTPGKSTNKENNSKKKQKLDIDDEYYDLEGF